MSIQSVERRRASRGWCAEAVSRFLILMLALSFSVAHAATFTVTNLNDSGSGSLRQAVLDANAILTSTHTIEFQPGLTGTITLVNGEIAIVGRMTINGPGQNVLAVSGNKTSGVFNTSSLGTTISGLTIKDGVSSAIYNTGYLTLSNLTLSDNESGNGGGIYNTGSLTLSDIILSGNKASHGGGIYNSGSLAATRLTLSGNEATGGYGGGIHHSSSSNDPVTVSNSTFTNNRALHGGGIYLYPGAITVSNSTLSGNEATSGSGGGIHVGGNLTVTHSTLSENSASDNGGGIYHGAGTLTVMNSTLSGNVVNGSGGGIFCFDATTITNSTLSGNMALTSGGGIDTGWGNALTLGNSIVAGNTALMGRNLNTTSGLQGGSNRFGENGASGVDGATPSPNEIIAGPLSSVIGPLANNGGPTLTHALVAGSPALNAGNNSLIPAGVTTDQRGDGFPRIVGGTVDIGAVEGTGNNANLIVNGSFEEGNYYDAQGSQRLLPNDTALLGWVIGGSGADWHVGTPNPSRNPLFVGAHLGPAQDGSLVVDLNLDGESTGTLSQTFATNVGTTYIVSFYMAGVDFFTNPRVVQITVDGVSRTFSQTASPQYQLVWGLKSFEFTATQSEATLTFSSPDMNGVWGPLIDNVSVLSSNHSSITHTLTVSKAGTGNGTVTSNPTGINCGATCSANFNSGASVTLSASADSGYSFTGWSGDCNGTSTTCTVTMDRAKSVIALFASQTPDTYPLAVSFTGMGTVTSNPVGIDCGFLRSDPCSVLFNEGTVVTLSAIPHSDRCCQNIFSGWGGACSGTSSTCTVTMDAAKNVTATFNAHTPETYALTLTTAGTGSGTVSGAGSYEYRMRVNLTATPNTGSTFVGWSPSPPCETFFIMPPNDWTCTATFTLNSHTVTATTGANGSITPTSRTVTHGATTTFTVTPNSGYRASVTGCNGTLSGNTYTTGPITGACSVSASFTTDSIDFDATVASTISWFYAAAFSRTPVPNSTLLDYGDLAGLAFWTSAFLTGEGGLAPYRGNVYAIADFFVQSPEFQSRYSASLTNEEFVTALYENMLDRAPDADGLAFWVGRLNAGASRGAVLADFTNTPENQDSNPLRKAAMQSFIAFLDENYGVATPAQAAAWLAANPTLDGKLVDGGSSSNVHTRVTGPLPSNHTYQMVQVDGQIYNVEAPAVLTSISTTQPVSIVDTEGRLGYFGYTTPEQTTLALSGESTAISLAFMPFNLFPLTGEAAALILNELAGHPDIAVIGARIEAIVMASGHFDIDQLTPDDWARIHAVSLAIASQASSGRATLSSLDSGLLPEYARFIQPQAAVDFIGPDTDYADYLRVLDYGFQRESGGSVKGTLTFENRTYLTYFAYRFSPSDPHMRLFETVPGAMPDSTVATVINLVREVKGAVTDFFRGNPVRLTLTGAKPQEKEIEVPNIGSATEVVTLQLSPRIGKAPDGSDSYAPLMANLVRLGLVALGYVVPEKSHSYQSGVMETFIQLQMDEFVQANRAEIDGAIASSNTNYLMQEAGDFIEGEYISHFYPNLSEEARKVAKSTAKKIVDLLGKIYGTSHFVTQLLTYPTHEYSVRPTSIEVEGTRSEDYRSLEVRWATVFGDEPETYNLYLVNTSTNAQQTVSHSGGTHSHTFSNLDQNVEYCVHVNQGPASNPQREVIEEGLNRICFPTRPTLTMRAVPAEVEEGGTVTLTFELSQKLPTDTWVNYTLYGSAWPDVDYRTEPASERVDERQAVGTLTIPASTGKATLLIHTVDDGEVEGDELFYAVTSYYIDMPYTFPQNPADARTGVPLLIKIIDNDEEEGLVVTATAGANGSITPASRTVNHGETTTFTVTPNSGYAATVTGCGGTLSGNTYTTGPVTAACTVTATFSQNISTYTVTATAGANGSITPPSRTVNHGATTTFTVTPNSGYTATVTGCGGTLSGNTYTTGPITEACTVESTFSQGGQSGCVEGQIIQVNGVNRYRVVGSDCSIVADLVTGLEWQRCSVGQTWNVIDQRCDGTIRNFYVLDPDRTLALVNQELTLPSPGGFRLPTITELRSLVYCSNTGAIGMYEDWPTMTCSGHGHYDPIDPNLQSPTIVSEAFPNTGNKPSNGYLSSSPGKHYGWDTLWYVEFHFGYVDDDIPNFYHARLVRSGQ